MAEAARTPEDGAEGCPNGREFGNGDPRAVTCLYRRGSKGDRRPPVFTYFRFVWGGRCPQDKLLRGGVAPAIGGEDGRSPVDWRGALISTPASSPLVQPDFTY